MRLIDADNLLYDIIGMKDGWLKPPKGVTTIEDLIKIEPTVICCKQCQYRNNPIACKLESEGMYMPDDWFCADGIPK